MTDNFEMEAAVERLEVVAWRASLRRAPDVWVPLADQYEADALSKAKDHLVDPLVRLSDAEAALSASNARALAAAEYLCRLEGALLSDDLDMKLNFPGEMSPTAMAEALVPGFDSVAYDLRRTTLASMKEKE